MNNLQYIFSPCGTSLLINQANSEIRPLVFKHANAKTKEAVNKEDRITLETLLADINEKIEKATIEDAKKMSAELNALLQIYNGEIPNQSDHLVLLSTDTWLGEQTAKLIEKWLRKKSTSISVEVRKQQDLQTKDLDAFQLALSELVRDLSSTIPDYRKKNYKIIFNLTGGFKSVQGFLQSISHFYADETVYIFESSEQLMKIPRLPVKLETKDLVEQHLDVFRQLEIEGKINPAQIENQQLDLFFLSLGDETVLSPYGEIVWAQAKSEIYAQSILNSPKSELVRYSNNFRKTVSDLAEEKMLQINSRIDQLCKHLSDSSFNPSSLDFKKLKGKPKVNSTHEMDAWADDGAKRLYGHFEEGCFVLDELGNHL